MSKSVQVGITFHLIHFNKLLQTWPKRMSKSFFSFARRLHGEHWKKVAPVPDIWALNTLASTKRKFFKGVPVDIPFTSFKRQSAFMQQCKQNRSVSSPDGNRENQSLFVLSFQIKTEETSRLWTKAIACF